jgi:integrase/recombinase XerC
MDRTALSPLLRSFERHLRAGNRSERTIATYLQSVQQAEACLHTGGQDLVGARRADLEAFLGDLLARRAAATVWTRKRRYASSTAGSKRRTRSRPTPMARMRPPIIPEQPVPVVPEDGLRRLFAVCAGKDFEARRDTALITILVDSGPRRRSSWACAS